MLPLCHRAPVKRPLKMSITRAMAAPLAPPKGNVTPWNAWASLRRGAWQFTVDGCASWGQLGWSENVWFTEVSIVGWCDNQPEVPPLMPGWWCTPVVISVLMPFRSTNLPHSTAGDLHAITSRSAWQRKPNL